MCACVCVCDVEVKNKNLYQLKSSNGKMRFKTRFYYNNIYKSDAQKRKSFQTNPYHYVS